MSDNVSVVLGYLARVKRYTLSLDELVRKVIFDKKFQNISEDKAREFVLNSLDRLQQESCVRKHNGMYTLTCKGYKDFMYLEF